MIQYHQLCWKRCKLLFIYCLLIKSSYGNLNSNDSTLNYYYQINNAEILIAKGNYEEAIISYAKIESKYGYLYGKDKLNLSICLLLLKDKGRATKYLSYLLKNGAKPEWLLKNSVIAKNYSPSELNKYYDSISRKNKTLCDSLNNIYMNDQKYRVLPNAYTVHKREIDIADSLNIIMFNKILSDYKGIPNEFQIGFSDQLLINPPFLLHVLHQSSGVKTFDYSEILLKEIKKGNINPHVGATLYARTSGNGNYFGPLTIRQTVFPTDSLTKEDLIDPAKFVQSPRHDEYLKTLPVYMVKIPESPNEVLDATNARRHNFGLESIEDFKQKVIFQVRHPEFNFYGIYKSVFIFDSKEKSDAMMKNYEPIQIN